jgi:hypothetical protein
MDMQPQTDERPAAGGERQIPNGPAAAAIMAAGIGCFALGMLSFVTDALPDVRRALIIWNPSGPLSGVSTAVILVWAAAWLVLSALWGRRELNLARVNLIAFVMLAVGMVLTFPPFADLLLGK